LCKRQKKQSFHEIFCSCLIDVFVFSLRLMRLGGRLSLLASDLIKIILISIYHKYRFFILNFFFHLFFLGHNNNNNMAQKVSINKRFSRIQSNSISFKNKRRRKPHTKSRASSLIVTSSLLRCTSLKTNKSPKHRWKLNGNERCMTNDRECFHQHFSHNNSPTRDKKFDEKCRQNEAVKSHVDDVQHFIAKTKSSSCEQKHVRDELEKSKPRRRDFVNCRKLLEWTTASSVRKLLPIFILVNMLPFLYAGESRDNVFTCMPSFFVVASCSHQPHVLSKKPDKVILANCGAK
jgi:hypothetical protein